MATWEKYAIDLDSATFGPNGAITDQQHSTTNDSDSNSNSDMISPTRNGVPKQQFSYTGSNRELFRQWKNLEISTQEFATRTAPGNGTASLVAPSQQTSQQPTTPAFSGVMPGGGGGGDTMMVVVLVGLAAAVAIGMGGN